MLLQHGTLHGHKGCCSRGNLSSGSAGRSCSLVHHNGLHGCTALLGN